jgi:hypothetical protein
VPLAHPTQVDVENFFISTYYLIRSCMPRYWNGLYAKRGIPWFYWTEYLMPRPGAQNYVNWGFNSKANLTQPTNFPWSQGWICGSSMLNESSVDTGAWGWGNRNCTEKSVSICKISREWIHCLCACLQLACCASG